MSSPQPISHVRSLRQIMEEKKARDNQVSSLQQNAPVVVEVKSQVPISHSVQGPQVSIERSFEENHFNHRQEQKSPEEKNPFQRLFRYLDELPTPDLPRSVHPYKDMTAPFKKLVSSKHIDVKEAHKKTMDMFNRFGSIVRSTMRDVSNSTNLVPEEHSEWTRNLLDMYKLMQTILIRMEKDSKEFRHYSHSR